jgi:hypothetical protein
LANRAVALVTLSEPLADASDVELILAGLARHLGQALVIFVHNAIADVAVLNAFDFSLDVSFPCENGRNDVSILELDNLSNSQDPFSKLLLRYFQLPAHVNFN